MLKLNARSPRECNCHGRRALRTSRGAPSRRVRESTATILQTGTLPVLRPEDPWGILQYHRARQQYRKNVTEQAPQLGSDGAPHL